MRWGVDGGKHKRPDGKECRGRMAVSGKCLQCGTELLSRSYAETLLEPWQRVAAELRAGIVANSYYWWPSNTVPAIRIPHRYTERPEGCDCACCESAAKREQVRERVRGWEQDRRARAAKTADLPEVGQAAQTQIRIKVKLHIDGKYAYAYYFTVPLGEVEMGGEPVQVLVNYEPKKDV